MFIIIFDHFTFEQIMGNQMIFIRRINEQPNHLASGEVENSDRQ